MPSNNKVTLTGATIRSVNYISGSFVITDGEDSKLPPKISSQGDVWTIEVEADRKGSKPVADKYVDTVGGVGHLAAKGGGDRPDALNFYYGLTVGFDVRGTTYPVTIYLAQGHFGTTNNWWFGGQNYFSAGSQLAVIGNNQVLETLKIGLDTSAFTLTPQ
jgi:hypothetical protein